MTESRYRQPFYDGYASHQGGRPQAVPDLAPRRPFLLQLIKRHFPAARDACIVDLGSGNGALVYFARQLGYRNLRGVEASAEQVAAAAALGVDQVTRADLLEEVRAVPDASLDAVVTLDVIEHLSKDELLFLALQISRCLKRTGRWIIHAPNAGSPFFGRMRYGDYTHEQAFTPESLHQLLHVAGFASVACFEDRPVVHGPLSLVRAFCWRGLRGLLRFYLAVETGDPASAALFSQNFVAVGIR